MLLCTSYIIHRNNSTHRREGARISIHPFSIHREGGRETVEAPFLGWVGKRSRANSTKQGLCHTDDSIKFSSSFRKYLYIRRDLCGIMKALAIRMYLYSECKAEEYDIPTIDNPRKPKDRNESNSQGLTGCQCQITVIPGHGSG